MKEHSDYLVTIDGKEIRVPFHSEVTFQVTRSSNFKSGYRTKGWAYGADPLKVMQLARRYEEHRLKVGYRKKITINGKTVAMEVDR